MKPARLMVALACCLPLLAPAAEVCSAGLPGDLEVRTVLGGLPQLHIAGSEIRRSQANRSALVAGPHEWTVRGRLQERRVENAFDCARCTEGEIAVERGVRWFGKAAQDAAYGEQTVMVAQLSYADTWHEAGRALLSSWFDWQREEHSAQLLQRQVEVLERQVAAVSTRVHAGEAAALEERMAQTELDRGVVAQRQAAQMAHRRMLDLRQQYPGLRLDLPACLEDPPAAIESDAAWSERILADNHELELADAELAAARLRAGRADAARTPDPTVGMHYGEERNRQERIVGLTIAIPIGGPARTAEHDAALAEVAVAEERARMVRLKVEADIARALAAAQANAARWTQLAGIASQAAGNADLVLRGYQLGEFGFNETLQARRQAIDSALAAQTAQLDALEAVARLRLDAHEIWAAPEEPQAAAALQH
ncbi:MAG: TolC family protein [Pseudomonadota bacterium]|nr:TolC family protein [Pseudomonadota bacterium]